MEQVKDYEWNDVILYSKGWYETCGNLYEDLARCIRENGNRLLTPPNREDALRNFVVTWMLHIFDDLTGKLSEAGNHKGSRLGTHSAFYEETRRRMYFHGEDEDEAICRTVLDFMLMLDRHDIKLERPVYGRGRRRIGRHLMDFKDNPMSMTYKEMNRIADRSFGRKEEK